MPDRRHVAVLLAAGGSLRLGRPKQLLQRDGESLVHRAARLALQTTPSRLIVVLGAQGDEIAAPLQDLAWQRIDNPDWREGLGSSLRLVQRALAAETASTLLLGCDQPALDVAHLQTLLAAARAAHSGCAATAYGERVGLPALVSAALLQSASPQGDRGLRDALARPPRAQLGIIDAGELALDIDTPEELARARAVGLVDA